MTAISHIDQVLPSIEGRKDFIHVTKDGYSVIDYVYQENDSWEDPIRVECRGLKFNQDGLLLARPLHKFFNLGEKNIKYIWKLPHVIMDKLDGSMVHSAMVRGQVVLMTRMGRTDHAINAERHLNDRVASVAAGLMERGCTPIFEWTSPENQIVLRYPDDKLTLLAIRHNHLGNYMPRANVETYAAQMGIEAVEVKSGLSFENDDQAADVRSLTEGIEGFVVWFPGIDQFVKIKTDEYVQMHRAVSFFDREDMVLQVVLDHQCDDLYPTLSEDRADRLRSYSFDVLMEVAEMVDIVANIHRVNKHLSRKDYAVNIVNKYPVQPLRSAMFKVADGADPRAAVTDVVRKHPEILMTRW